MGRALSDLDQAALETTHQGVFTLSYSEDCPINETAFSARHLFQQTAHQADIAGFYRAFGVDTAQDRSDLLAMELEFCYLLALKESHARSRREPEHVSICRQAHRRFLREHLARWAPLAAKRITVTGKGTFYERAARVLLAFISAETKYLRLGPIDLYRDDPVLIADEPGDLTCPVMTGAVEEFIEWPASAEGVDDGIGAAIG